MPIMEDAIPVPHISQVSLNLPSSSHAARLSIKLDQALAMLQNRKLASDKLSSKLFSLW